jgi:hypothetical protein
VLTGGRKMIERYRSPLLLQPVRTRSTPNSKPSRLPLRLNRNFMNYPLARSAKTKPNWRKDKDGWWCRLPGDDRIELSLPEAHRTLRRCPTAFDMNVLFRLLAAIQEAQPQRTERVRFASVAAALRDLHLSAHSENGLRLISALELWGQMSIRLENWYEDRDHIARHLPPPIERADLSGNSIVLTLNREWVRLALSKRYYESLPLPLPSEATAQNMVLMLLTSMPNRIEGKFRGTYSRARSWFCRKIGLRNETTKLARITDIASNWFAACDGCLIHFDGDNDPSNTVRPGEVQFAFEMLQIPRRKTRRSKGNGGQQPDGRRGVKTGKPDGRRGRNKKLKLNKNKRNDTAGAVDGRYRSGELERSVGCPSVEYRAAVQPLNGRTSVPARMFDIHPSWDDEEARTEAKNAEREAYRKSLADDEYLDDDKIDELQSQQKFLREVKRRRESEERDREYFAKARERLTAPSVWLDERD